MILKRRKVEDRRDAADIKFQQGSGSGGTI
jgi:hypothetical protein